jgi:hypothetical protein
MNQPASPPEASNGQRKRYEPPRLLLPSVSASDAEKTTHTVVESRFGDPHYGPAS